MPEKEWRVFAVVSVEHCHIVDGIRREEGGSAGLVAGKRAWQSPRGLDVRGLSDKIILYTHPLTAMFNAWRTASARSFSHPRLPLGFNTRPQRPLIFCRKYQHLSQNQQDPKSAQPKAQTPAPTPTSTPNPSSAPSVSARDRQDLTSNSNQISAGEQRKRDWSIVRKLAVNVWPKDDWGTRGRVLLGVGLLVAGKVCSHVRVSLLICDDF